MLRRCSCTGPALELERLTPRNKDDLLFDDVLWVQARAPGTRRVRRRPGRARRRGALAAAPARRDAGREPAARAEVLERTAARRRPRAAPRPVGARSGWPACPPAELAERLIGGIAYDELPFPAASLQRAAPGARRLRCSRRSRTTSSRATRRPGSTTASASTTMAKPARVARGRPPRRRSTATTRSSPADDSPIWSEGALGRRLARGRRRPRHRQRMRARRHGRAHPAGGGRAARRPAVRRPAAASS